jgi:DNA invertase Pin-like site-specific DNA recombinase
MYNSKENTISEITSSTGISKTTLYRKIKEYEIKILEKQIEQIDKSPENTVSWRSISRVKLK